MSLQDSTGESGAPSGWSWRLPRSYATSRGLRRITPGGSGGIASRGVQNSRFRNRQSAIRNSRGFTYIALLAALVIIGISLGAAGKYWQNVMLRDKEEELLFRGDQYRQAIERYYLAIPTRPQYPESIDKLLNDDRTPAGKRHLRQRYKDPFTGEDFVEIRDPLTNRITGVHSGSDKTPLKQANFPVPYEDFAGKGKYSDWQFVSTIKVVQPVTPLPARPPVIPKTQP